MKPGKVINSTFTKRSTFNRLNIAGVFFFSAAVVLIFLYPGFGIANSDGKDTGGYLPFSIRATSQADYQTDPDGFLVKPVNENILDQLIADIPATGLPQDRISTLQAGLNTPVPTMTYYIPPNTSTAATITATFPAGTLTPRASSTPTSASPSTSVPTTVGSPTTSPLLPTIPPVLPTIPPVLPTNPPLPTIPPLIPTSVPTIPPLPTLPSLTLFP